jgi:hypothetical protein
VLLIAALVAAGNGSAILVCRAAGRIIGPPLRPVISGISRRSHRAAVANYRVARPAAGNLPGSAHAGRTTSAMWEDPGVGSDEDIRLPLVLGPVSNGEFMPAAASAADIGLARAVIGRAARAADALGMDRRLFLQTAGGMAALLATVNLAACSGGTVAGLGGRYKTPPPEELHGCEAALGSRGRVYFRCAYPSRDAVAAVAADRS